MDTLQKKGWLEGSEFKDLSAPYQTATVKKSKSNQPFAMVTPNATLSTVGRKASFSSPSSETKAVSSDIEPLQTNPHTSPSEQPEASAPPALSTAEQKPSDDIFLADGGFQLPTNLKSHLKRNELTSSTPEPSTAQVSPQLQQALVRPISLGNRSESNTLTHWRPTQARQIKPAPWLSQERLDEQDPDIKNKIHADRREKKQLRDERDLYRDQRDHLLVQRDNALYRADVAEEMVDYLTTPQPLLTYFPAQVTFAHTAPINATRSYATAATQNFPPLPSSRKEIEMGKATSIASSSPSLSNASPAIASSQQSNNKRHDESSSAKKTDSSPTSTSRTKQDKRKKS